MRQTNGPVKGFILLDDNKDRCGKHNKYTVIIEKNEDDADFEQVEVIGKVK